MRSFSSSFISRCGSPPTCPRSPLSQACQSFSCSPFTLIFTSSPCLDFKLAILYANCSRPPLQALPLISEQPCPAEVFCMSIGTLKRTAPSSPLMKAARQAGTDVAPGDNLIKRKYRCFVPETSPANASRKRPRPPAGEGTDSATELAATRYRSHQAGRASKRCRLRQGPAGSAAPRNPPQLSRHRQSTGAPLWAQPS